MRHLATLILLGVALQAAADRSLTLRIGPSFGQDILGSEDTRRGALYAIGAEWPERRLTFRGGRASLRVEAYYMFSKGGGFEDVAVDHMHSWGVIAEARYVLPFWPGVRATLDLGWGIVLNDITTRDLDRRLNSTPSVGITASIERYSLTARFFHISNAGTAGNNQGLNAVQILVGTRL